MCEDARLKTILCKTRVIACVGASANPARPSHYVSRFLQSHGYRVIPVNPGLAGGSLWGETVAGSLSDIPHEINVDFVDIFKRSEQVRPFVEEALQALPHLRTIWMQLGIEDHEAARIATDRGVNVVMNRCPIVEIPKLFGPQGTPLG